MQEGAVGLGAALRLALPVTGSHVPLLGAYLQVAEDAVILGAVTLPPVSADCLVAEGEGLVSEGAVIGSGAAGVVIEVTVLARQSLAFALAGEATMNLGHYNMQRLSSFRICNTS